MEPSSVWFDPILDSWSFLSCVQNITGAPSMSSKPKFPCSQCQRVYGRKSDLNRHHNSVHMRQWSHQCPSALCGKTFARKDVWKRHIKICKSRSLPMIQNEAGFQFSSMATLLSLTDMGNTDTSTQDAAFLSYLANPQNSAALFDSGF